jgi:hypothetical protein
VAFSQDLLFLNGMWIVRPVGWVAQPVSDSSVMLTKKDRSIVMSFEEAGKANDTNITARDLQSKAPLFEKETANQIQLLYSSDYKAAEGGLMEGYLVNIGFAVRFSANTMRTLRAPDPEVMAVLEGVRSGMLLPGGKQPSNQTSGP